MRQAGRYLPEYRALRETTSDFISYCLDSEKASEATLQPITRFDFDAAIIFADILLVPQALGADLCFVENEGPKLSQIKCKNDILRLKPAESIHEHLKPIYKTVNMVSKLLDRKTALIGFAGAPWTVATYMVAGKGTKDQAPAHRMIKEDINELIFALSATMEGDTTNYYIYRKIKKEGIKFSTIARGVSVGDNLEYTDEITLGRSILKRIPFEQTST